MPVCPKCGHEGSSIAGKCPYDEYYFVAEDVVAAAKRDPMIGSLAAEKYVILSLISEGGMGAVYRAEQLPIKREVAFKVLRAELKDSDQGRDRFIREARAVARLIHPNIITLHDFGFDESDYPYMVMEYAPGVSLAAWLSEQTLSVDRVVHIVGQVLSALTDAHEAGIVHRDLKPENLIVMKSGVDHDFVKLLDFGIARVINEGATRSLTREGEVFGTPHYMAPEQAQGKKDIGPPADVYAVGVMLFEMLTGATPYDAPTPLAVLFQHINEPIPDIVGRAGVNVSEALKRVVQIAMAKEPSERYQNAGEMLKSLHRAMASAPPSGRLAAVIQEGVTGTTMPPGAAPLQLKTIGGPTPQFEIAAGELTGDRVNVFDPDPSIEGAMPLMAAPGSVSRPREEAIEEFGEPAGVRSLLYIGIGVVVAIIAVLMVVVISSGDEKKTATADAAQSEPAKKIAKEKKTENLPKKVEKAEEALKLKKRQQLVAVTDPNEVLEKKVSDEAALAKAETEKEKNSGLEKSKVDELAKAKVVGKKASTRKPKPRKATKTGPKNDTKAAIEAKDPPPQKNGIAPQKWGNPPKKDTKKKKPKDARMWGSP